MKSLRIEGFALTIYLIRDTYAGAIRYYMDRSGLGPLWFIPDLVAFACLAVFIYRSVYKDGCSVALGVVAYLPFSSIVGYFFLENVNAAFSSVKMILPVFVGFCFCGRRLSDYRCVLFVTEWLLYSTIFGILLSSCLTLPWVGYSFESFGVERQSTRIWWTAGELRLSGFAADSTMAAFFVMIPFVITSLRRNWIWCLVMGGVSLYAIDLTTNKTALGTLGIYIATLLLLRSVVRRQTIPALQTMARASFLCLLIPPVLMLMLSGTDLASMTPTLFSLQDRINNSWQNPFIFMWDLMPTGFLSGCGLGCFNYPQEVFNVKIEYYVPVDNFYIGTLLMLGPIFLVFVILAIHAIRWTYDPYKLTVLFVMNIFTITVLSYGPASGLIMIALGFSEVFRPARFNVIKPSPRPQAGQARKPVIPKWHAAPFGSHETSKKRGVLIDV